MLQIFGILLAFSLIIIMVNKKIALGYALIIGSIIVGAFSGLGVSGIAQTFASALVDPVTIRLVIVLALIGVLGHSMQKMKVLTKLVASLNRILKSPKLTITVIPSIMGTLLVTGGAVMAAPLVDEIGDDLSLSRPKKAAINLIFRHGWYFIYPLMPTFILMAETAGIDKFALIKLQWPLTLAMIATGYFLWVRPAKINQELPQDKVARKDIKQLILTSAPLWVSLTLALVLEKVNFTSWGFSPSLASILTQLAFPIALCLGIIIAVLLGEKAENKVTKTLVEGLKPAIILSGVGIMIFKAMVGQLTVLNDLVLSFLNTGIPLFVIFVTLPWLTGFLSASATSAIGITLPLLLPALALSSNPLPYVMLMYSSAFMGYLVSPLHLCQVLTLEYFKVKISELYREYKVVIPLTFVVSLVVFFLVR